MTCRRSTDPSLRERAEELWADGVENYAEIARRLGCTREYVRAVLGNRRGRFNAVAALEEIRRELERPIVAVLDRMLDPEHGFRHGTRNGHQYQGCRCFWCVEAKRLYVKHEARERWLAGKNNPTHGTASTYRVYGCRCEPCTRANTEANRPYSRAYAERQRRARRAV